MFLQEQKKVEMRIIWKRSLIYKTKDLASIMLLWAQVIIGIDMRSSISEEELKAGTESGYKSWVYDEGIWTCNRWSVNYNDW